MKFINIIIGVLLLTGLAVADNDVVVHVNYPDDQFIIGAVNMVEIWIENDVTVSGLSLGFEFSGYSGQIDWKLDYGTDQSMPVLWEGALAEVFSIEVANTFSMDDSYLPDSLLIGGVTITDAFLTPGPSRKCLTMLIRIPAGEPTGQICIDNVWLSPTGDWHLVDYASGGVIQTNYFGCVNSSDHNPDCPAVCFPVSQAWFDCADVNFDTQIDVSDLLMMLQAIFYSAPLGTSVRAADIDCSGRFNVADAAYYTAYLFAGGPPPDCTQCP